MTKAITFINTKEDMEETTPEKRIEIEAFDIIDNSQCNAKCIHCCRGATIGKMPPLSNHKVIEAIQKIKKYGRDPIMLDRDRLRTGYSKEHLPTRFNFSGGEPVLCKNLNDFIKTATAPEGDKKFTATISSNGFWGHKAKSLLPAYYDMGVRKITISIDGFRQTNNRIRGIKLYDKLMNIIDTAVQYRKEGVKIPAIAVNTTAMPQNIQEIDTLADYLWNKIEKDPSGFNLYAGFVTRYGKAAGIQLSEEEIKKVQETRKFLKDNGFEINDETYPYNYSFEKYAQNPTCGKDKDPLKRVYLSNDQNLYLCAEHYAPYNLALGSIDRTPIEELIENCEESDLFKLFIGNQGIEERKWYLKQMDADRYKGIMWPNKCVPCATLNAFVRYMKSNHNVKEANDYAEKLTKGIKWRS